MDQRKTSTAERSDMKISSEFSEMTTDFMFRWKLDRIIFETAENLKEPAIIVGRYIHFPWTENLTFYLRLHFDINYGFSVSIHHDFQNNCRLYEDVSLKYAFICTENRMFSLGPKTTFPFEISHLTFSNFMSNSEFWRENNAIITIHCHLVVETNVHVSKLSFREEKSSFYSVLSPCRGHQTGIEMNCRALSTKDEESAVINKYRFSGEIPELNAERAMKLYQRCHSSRFGELTAICLEYLLYNLTPENVIEVLMFAHKNNLEELSTKCVEFLTRKCQLLSIN